MKSMKRARGFRLVLTGVALAGLAVVVPPASANAATAAYSDCPSGNVCFYTGTGGTGSRCNWSNADSDWASGAITCSWALTSPARSMYNHGTSTAFTAVAFYHGVNYTSYNGCMGQGWAGNIGPAYLRSHQWVTFAC
ncbi:peptidase inhibitor family I36 protein [Streptomyces sp. NPDC093252]|uniref:peptidase inhibitor family I36 protein n=1 Tax=Streptomyces sp. NPDC093252 TaxID=3154980 RepID=UPI00344899AC